MKDNGIFVKTYVTTEDIRSLLEETFKTYDMLDYAFNNEVRTPRCEDSNSRSEDWRFEPRPKAAITEHINDLQVEHLQGTRQKLFGRRLDNICS
jgi:hypothetical protein